MDWKENISKRIIIDNGSYQIRYGNASSLQPDIIWLNLLGLDRAGNLMHGEQLQNYLNEDQLTYYKPQVRGVVVDWDNEVQLWEKLLDPVQKEINQSCLILTYHPCQPEKVRQRMMEVAFEYFNFDAFYPALSQSMIREFFLSINDQINKEMQLIVESSHSATYLVPFFDGEPLNYASLRMEVGGKLLTNYLKEIIGLRYFDLKKQVKMVSQIKEELCFVADNMDQQMKKPKFSHAKHFILPDLETGKKGFATDILDQISFAQRLTLDKERFQIPEIIFRPADIGLNQNGIVQSIKDAIFKIHPDLQNYYFENIVLSGGNTFFQNLSNRVYNEIRENSPDYLNTRVYHIDLENNPVFQGAKLLANSPNFENIVIKKQDYKEKGFDALQKFYYY